MTIFPLLLPATANAGETRGDVELTPLNSLAFNYRGSTEGAAPKPVDEFSIDYSEFLTFLSNGMVDNRRVLPAAC
ncbi:hypothetical protein TrRE_jg4241 [Triparma retinervis]|uniref:Uncharacterized protein n=1 Tax=Triparma retinervis TaxID=2557542 RepID=A0A9W6ZAU7_9STRA|nr:hypothetical protein TrRE_jg4241 [Triparma retinervis]